MSSLKSSGRFARLNPRATVARAIPLRPGKWLIVLFGPTMLDADVVRQACDVFLDVHPGGRLIAFDYSLFHSHFDERITYWREELRLEDELRMSKSGYERVDQLLDLLTIPARRQFERVYHDLGAESFRAAAVAGTIESAGPPAAILLRAYHDLRPIYQVLAKKVRNARSRNWIGLRFALVAWALAPLAIEVLEGPTIRAAAKRIAWASERVRVRLASTSPPPDAAAPRIPRLARGVWLPLKLLLGVASDLGVILARRMRTQLLRRWYRLYHALLKPFTTLTARRFFLNVLGRNRVDSIKRAIVPSALQGPSVPLAIPATACRVDAEICEASPAAASSKTAEAFGLSSVEPAPTVQREPTPDAPAEYLVVLEDPGSHLLLSRALLILNELSAQGLRSFVLTSSQFVVDRLRHTQHSAVRFAAHPSPRWARFSVAGSRIRRISRYLLGQGANLHDQLFGCLMLHRDLRPAAWAANEQRQIGQLIENLQPRAVLTIPEPAPLPIFVGQIAQDRALPWFSYLNFIIGDHPECKFWPAQRHLVYGSQAAELLSKAGCDPASISVVGSINFDQTLRRDRANDRASVAALLPSWSGQPIVVIGTEQRAEQVTDIGHVLSALRNEQDLYVVVKVHPADSVVAFERLAARFIDSPSRVAVIGECDLDALLGEASLLVCQRSNIIVTAAILGTPTLVCAFGGSQTIVDFVEEGIAVGCPTPADIRRLIRQYVFDEVSRAQLLRSTARNLHRFNGPNDGNSTRRIVANLTNRTGTFSVGSD